MKSLILLASLLGAISFTAASCDACLDGFCYHKNTISNDSDAFKVAIDRSTNTLHFSGIQHESYHYNLDNGTSRIMSYDGIWAYAEDQKLHEIYGASYQKGIYKLDAATNKFQPYALLDRDVAILYFKDKLYFKMSLENGLYVLNGNDSYDQIQSLNEYYITSFILDKNDDIYFKVNAREVYRLKKGTQKAKIFLQEDYVVLAADTSNNAVFIKNDSKVYKLNYDTDGIEWIGDIGIRHTEPGYDYQIAFDRDNNFVYNDPFLRTIYHFRRSPDLCVVTDSGIRTVV